jgi:hypothetical protein
VSWELTVDFVGTLLSGRSIASWISVSNRNRGATRSYEWSQNCLKNLMTKRKKIIKICLVFKKTHTFCFLNVSGHIFGCKSCIPSDPSSFFNSRVLLF